MKILWVGPIGQKGTLGHTTAPDATRMKEEVLERQKSEGVVLLFVLSLILGGILQG